MFNLIQRFFKKDFKNKSQFRKNFAANFFSLPEHQWILLNGAQPHFEKLFTHLPVGVLEWMQDKHPVHFVPSTVIKSQDVGHPIHNTVVVFPEFMKLLCSDKKAAVAYLAHELAFIIYEFEVPEGNSLMAEVEADKFVSDIGFTFELEDLLLMLDETIEKRLRLTYLTIHHFTRNE